jgi:hypothetical protein
MRALARHITGSQATAVQARAAADPEHGDAETMLAHPPVPLPSYQVLEITVTGDSAAAGRKLGDLSWPPAGTLVSVLHGRRLRPPDSEITLSPGDRVSLLIPAPYNGHPVDPEDSSHAASREASSESGSP